MIKNVIVPVCFFSFFTIQVFFVPVCQSDPVSSRYSAQTVTVSAEGSDLKDLSNGARFVDFYKDGKFSGVRATAVKQDSQWAKWGFRNGDIITSIDGNQLKSMKGFWSELTRVKERNQFTINRTRVNKEDRPHSLSDGQGKIFTKASSRLQKNCQEGDAQSCALLEQLVKGQGDASTQEEVYKEACRKGNTEACVLLAQLAESRGRRYAKEDYIRLACKGGDAKSCAQLRTSAKREKDAFSQELRYFSACNHGDSQSCDLLEKAHERAKKSTDYKKKCSEAPGYACFRQGQIEERQGKIAAAKNYFQTACRDGGHLEACASLGFLEYMHGSKAEAKVVYQTACLMGHKESCAFVKEKYNN